MNLKTPLVLFFLFSIEAFSQSLPDEINPAPYEARHQILTNQMLEAERSLKQNRTELLEAQRFIQDMTGHVHHLENQIRLSENRISSHQRLIPQLQSEMNQIRFEQSRIGPEIRRLQSEESHLQSRYQIELRQLKPLEILVAQKEQRIRELQADVSQLQRQEKDLADRITKLQSELALLDKQTEDERLRQRQLRSELEGIENRIAQASATVAQLESQIAVLENHLNSERQKLNALISRVEGLRLELNRLRTEGAPAAQIAQAERRLGAAIQARDQMVAEIRKLEGQLNQQQHQLRGLRSRIDELRRDQNQLPARIAQSEAQERQLMNERVTKGHDLPRFQSELSGLQRGIQVRETSLAQARAEIRQDEFNLNRQKQVVDNLARQISSIKNEIVNLNSRSRHLDTEVLARQRRVQDLQFEIPQLEAAIRNHHSEIVRGKRELSAAKNDEARFQQMIAHQEMRLGQLVSEREIVHSQREERANLFERYLLESQHLGLQQASAATPMGEKEGFRAAQLFSKRNGDTVGRELGQAQARHWGHVRGELQGYEKGLDSGLSSAGDRRQGELEGEAKGKLDARLFAETTLKPIFFEEFLENEFKKPILAHTKSFRTSNKKANYLEEGFNCLDPLTVAELNRSQELITSLDSLIINYAQDVKTIEAKARRLGDPSVSFEIPSTIPFGSPQCNQVYKGLTVFRQACETSYQRGFRDFFVESMRLSFASDYRKMYESFLMEAQIRQRENSYAAEYASAFKVSEAQGYKEGREQIYQQAFSIFYRAAYDKELILAREAMKSQALTELQRMLDQKALLTLDKVVLRAEDFRGGAEVSVEALAKNISRVFFQGASTLRITEVHNAEVIKGEALLGQMPERSAVTFPLLKLKISSLAKAGDKVIVKGVAELPGDLYRTQRFERFELSQVLTANPAHKLDLSYNRTPDIKGVFRRNIHFLTANIAPLVEDLPSGYELRLLADADSSSLVELREGTYSSGSLKVNQVKEGRFSYLFADAAKGKKVGLSLEVLYQGKILRTERLELVPR
jgi:septal ring factor EnvC (AmiA/AmiB activator)